MAATAVFITPLVGWVIALADLGLLGLALFYFFDRERFEKILRMLAPHALAAGALLGGGAIVMSLYYSHIVGYPVCPLCWWQRIAIYPIAFIFAIAWWRGDTRIGPYVYALAIFGLLVGGYHEWLQVGGTSPFPCAAGPTDVPCDRVYINELGFVTFPVMAMTIFAYYSVLARAASGFVKK